MTNKNNDTIQFKKVSKKYRQGFALKNVNLSIPNHKIFVIVGPSGSGKTTILKLINHLIKPTSGEVIINNKSIDDYSIRKLRLKMGYVLQNIALFPNLNIYENIGIQLKALHQSKNKRLQTAKDLMRKADMEPNKYGKRYPNELSGGEQQRIGIIRALATKPKIILMDEPFSALDPIIKSQLQDLVLNLQKKFKTTLVFITHDMNEALKMGDKIAVIHNGNVLQVDSPQNLLSNPKDQLVVKMFQQQSTKMVFHIIQDNLAKPISSDQEEFPAVKFNAPISELAKILEHHSAAKIKFQNKSWIINKNDLISFIANERTDKS